MATAKKSKALRSLVPPTPTFPGDVTDDPRFDVYDDELEIWKLIAGVKAAGVTNIADQAATLGELFLRVARVHVAGIWSDEKLERIEPVVAEAWRAVRNKADPSHRDASAIITRIDFAVQCHREQVDGFATAEECADMVLRMRGRSSLAARLADKRGDLIAVVHAKIGRRGKPDDLLAKLLRDVTGVSYAGALEVGARRRELTAKRKNRKRT